MSAQNGKLSRRQSTPLSHFPSHQSGSRHLLENYEYDNSLEAFSLLRKHLLIDSDYDKFSYPFDRVQYLNETDNTIRGLDVEVSINFHKVREVDVVGASADMLAWFRMYWYDTRLSWNPEDFNNITSIKFWVEGGSGASETSEIWVPDMYLWNAQEPMSKSLEDTRVIVTSDGRCSWSRPGHLIPACKFEGIERFPFDELSCEMEFGSWAYSGMYLFPHLASDPANIGGSDTAGQTYAEFSLADVTYREHIYPPYPVAPQENWPAVIFEVHFKRAWRPYARGYITIQFLLNLTAFGCFWLPPHLGERMGLGITSLLAAVASELVISPKIPLSSEMSWIVKFSLCSLIFNSLVVFQSVIVIFIHFHRKKYIMPRYILWLQSKTKYYQESYKLESEHNKGRIRNAANPLFFLKSSTLNKKTNVSSSNEKTSTTTEGELNADLEDIRLFEEQSTIGVAQETDQGLEFKLNEIQSNEKVPKGENKFVAFNDEKDMKSARRINLEAHIKNHAKNDDLSSNGGDFFGRDADDYKTREERKNNARWQTVADIIDEFSRVFFPLAYFIAMSVILAKS